MSTKWRRIGWVTHVYQKSIHGMAWNVEVKEIHQELYPCKWQCLSDLCPLCTYLLDWWLFYVKYSKYLAETCLVVICKVQYLKNFPCSDHFNTCEYSHLQTIQQCVKHYQNFTVFYFQELVAQWFNWISTWILDKLTKYPCFVRVNVILSFQGKKTLRCADQ